MADLIELNSSGSTKIVGSDSSGNEIGFVSSSSPGSLGSISLHSFAPDIGTASTALGALNASVQIELSGTQGVAFQLSAGTLIGTIQPQCSIDGGTNWINVGFLDSSNGGVLPSVTYTSANTLSIYSIITIDGASHCRVIVSLYTSGTANGLLRASQGQGLKPPTTSLTGFGADFNFGDVLSTSTPSKTVRRTTYTEQTSNAQRSFSSSSANDSSAGTGARQIKLTYFDVNGVGPLTETITMNGTTAVNTVATNICFIEKIKVISVGSTGSNVGIITMYAASGAGGGAMWTIAATDNQTISAHHYIAAGKTANITGISCSHSGTTVGSGGVFTMAYKTITGTNNPTIQVSDFVRLYGQSSTFSRVYQSPIKLAGPARIEMRVIPETSSSTTYRSAFDYFQP